MKLIAAAAAILLGAAAPSSAILLREQAWTPRAEARAFLEEPAECLASRESAVEIGRALFRSPALLGGPAARAGLSCNACHSGGRRNGRFLLPELTSRAGAADVTSEWSSKVRGDGVANPVDIPDLSGVTRRPAFGQSRDPSLEHFLRSVVVEEFQGEEPSDATMRSLLAYLRALDEGECSSGATAITLSSAAEDVRRAVTAADDADAGTARLVLLAAQDAMGRIVERLPARRFGAERTRLATLSRELGAIRTTGDVNAAMDAALPGWRVRFDATLARLARRERQTYFNERTLGRALVQQLLNSSSARVE
ncbi:MAG: hypothetical protein AB7H66_15730 [Hyphomonadaceae bacterium]